VTADVIAWLESPEGEAWSRERHDSAPPEITVASTLWRPAPGHRDLSQDPCGWERLEAAGQRGGTT
jgi:hypothetical protein